MSTYLERFGEELDAAAARMVAGNLPRHRGPRPSAAAAGVAVAIAIAVIALGSGGPPQEREATPADSLAGTQYIPPRPPPELRGTAIAFAGEAIPAIHIEGELADVGWKTRPPGRRELAGADLAGLFVRYASGRRTQAELLAKTLGAAGVEEADQEDPLVVVVGDNPVFPGAVDAYRSQFSVLDANGESSGTGRFRLYVLGGSLCITGPGGGTCASYADALEGDLALSQSGLRRPEKWGAAPDSVKSVRVRGEKILVSDNVWIWSCFDNIRVTRGRPSTRC